MLISTIKKIITRDLEKLKEEILLYNDERKIWVTEKKIANSAGNLCLHLVGNLNTFIGSEIGKTGYIRDRELEFSMKDVSREELVSKIEHTISVVNSSLDGLQEADMEREYALKVLPEKTSTGYFLVHLTCHLGYHLGQVNYHRRLLDY